MVLIIWGGHFISCLVCSLEQIDHPFDIQLEGAPQMTFKAARKQVLLGAELAGEVGQELIVDALDRKGSVYHLETS